MTADMRPDQRIKAIELRRRIDALAAARGAEERSKMTPPAPKREIKPMPVVSILFKKIARAVAISRTVPIETVIMIGRNVPSEARARWEAWWIYACISGASYAGIAHMIGADHSSIRHGVMRYAEERGSKPPREMSREEARAAGIAAYETISGKEWPL